MSALVEVPVGIYGPGYVYLGSLSKGRVAFDTFGRRMKVVRQGEGSTVVKRAGKTRMVGGRTFTPPETITLSSSTAVRLRKES